MLEIKDLHVEAGGREILKGVSLTIGEGETCVLFGPNGSGKSTLLAAIMGYGHCTVTKGEILFKGQDITHMGVDERARLGIGMMMQRPPNVAGVKLGDLVRAAAGNDPNATKDAESFKMDNFLERDVNVGFSGGEIKRSELLQLSAQKPDFVLLDEPESGVDLESIDLIGRKVHDLLYMKSGKKGCDGSRCARHVSALVITHTGQILDYIGADKAYILQNGVIRCSGRPTDLLKDIRERGYKECISCRMVNIQE
ncbi:MAG: ABC transporter ATP-binding protein [Candidatus Methanomethylophilaceae archaeon]|nr:ABC transporter ATP-binding protein [Candidatus Methanomethylophilaceae archaeon]MDY5872959.1 ABC transporter ATP-binding protein [Candidatus Methanomethylophilaceae archaeon]